MRHILCEKQSKILEALKELQGWTDETTDPPTVHEPAKFNQVAMKYSEDAARDGGNLGWRTRQMLHGVFADAAFKLALAPWSTVDKRKGKMTPQCVPAAAAPPPGPAADTTYFADSSLRPIKTSHGYHLILVEDKKA